MYKEPGECQFDDRDDAAKENEPSLLDRFLAFLYAHLRFGGTATLSVLFALITSCGNTTNVQPPSQSPQTTHKLVDTQNKKRVVTFPTASPSPTTDGNKKEDGKP